MALSAVSLPYQRKKKTSGDLEGGWPPARPQPFRWQIGERRQLLASAARQLLASGGNVASAMLLADRCEAAIAGECGKAIAGGCGKAVAGEWRKCGPSRTTGR